jgi:hypothetical protein
MVLGGAIVLPATREVVRGYLDYMPTAPEGLTTLVNIWPAPPAPFIPEDLVGTPVVMILTVFTGDFEEGEKAIAPLRQLGELIVDTVEPIPYPAIYNYTQELTNRHGVALRSMFSDQMSDEAIDAALDAVHNTTSPVALVHLRTQGGAISRVASDATAFAHRTQKYFISAIAVWFPDDPAGGERRVRELPAERGAGADRGRVPGGDAAPAAGGEEEVRPDKHVQVQPEHRAGVVNERNGFSESGPLRWAAFSCSLFSLASRKHMTRGHQRSRRRGSRLLFHGVGHASMVSRSQVPSG